MVNHAKIELAHTIFKNSRYPVNKSYLLDRLDCSTSTFKRIIKSLKDEHGAPIVYDKASNGYFYTDEKFELNLLGFWLSPETLLALVSTQKLLAQLKLDFLDQSLQTLKQHIERYLIQHKHQLPDLQRIQILPINARIHDTTQFRQIIDALLQRQPIQITYHARGDNTFSERMVSPQRLSHYRDNWYLDAWCHLRKQMRIFALDRIRQVTPVNQICKDISETELNHILASGYGIFSGQANHTATLIFSAQRARWVADENWHPKQSGSWLDDGRYQLQIPYSDERELLMDIMRHLPEVEIASPPELKQTLLRNLQQAIQQHQSS